MNQGLVEKFHSIYFRLYDQYSFQIIPVMGQLIVGQWKSYQYLVESIRKFPKQEDFKVKNIYIFYLIYFIS